MGDGFTGSWARHSRYAFLRGRGGRREFWIGFGLILVIGMTLRHVLGPRGQDGVEIGLLFLQVRWLHDFGRSGWWAGLGHAVPVAELVAVLAIGGNTPAAQGLAIGVA